MAVDSLGEHMKTMFVFTVDVESRTHGDPGSDILGILPGYEERYGIEKIMGMLETYQVRGTFFLNVYEAAKHGEVAVAGAARLIHSRGHDLELHSHPQPMYPHYGMCHAPLVNQIAILNKGISLLESWTGKTVLAHRAGAFAANADTLRACESVGLLADCSLSPGSLVSVPLIHDLGASNLVRRIGKVWEIPVTYYHQLRVGRWHSKRILDIEGSSLPEIKRVTRWSIRQSLPMMCILMHSFSLSRHGKPNRRVIRRLSALLTWLSKCDGIEIGTIEQACHRLDQNAIPEVISGEPSTGFLLTWGRALLAWNDGWRNRLVAMTGVSGLAALMLVLVYLCLTLLKY